VTFGGERPQRAAPLDDALGSGKAHVAAGAQCVYKSAPPCGVAVATKLQTGVKRCALRRRRRQRWHPQPRRRLPVTTHWRPRRRRRLLPAPTGYERRRPCAYAIRHATTTAIAPSLPRVKAEGHRPPFVPPPSDRPPRGRTPLFIWRRRRRRPSAARLSSPPATAAGVADFGSVTAARSPYPVCVSPDADPRVQRPPVRPSFRP